MKSLSKPAPGAQSCIRIAGGYTLITGTALIAAWCAYKQRSIRLADLRAWFACCELAAQRRASGPDTHFRPGEKHVAALTACGERAAGESMHRLRACGLLESDGSEMSIPASTPSTIASEHRFQQALAQLSHHRRRVPVPRRMLRLLARSGRPVMTATVIAHLLRCMFIRDGHISTNGLCKASWVAVVFGVDERNVKAARKDLLSLDWLRADPASQRLLNRWGLPVRINPFWSAPPPAEREPTAKTPPRPVDSAPKTPPPLRNMNRLRRSLNSKPVRPSRHGACAESEESPEITLRAVQLADLRSPNRLRVLFEEAVRAGFVRRCQADEFRFAAAAERALRLGTRNPAGFFATVIRRGLWHVISQADEDAAKRRAADSSRPPSRTDSERLPAQLTNSRSIVEELLGAETWGLRMLEKASVPPGVSVAAGISAGANPANHLAPRRCA